MRIIYKRKGEGKTTDLIKLSAGTRGKVIVCINQSDVYRILDEAKNMGVNIPTPMSYDEFANCCFMGDAKHKGTIIESFLIDNADLLLQYLTRVNIEAITLTKKG